MKIVWIHLLSILVVVTLGTGTYTSSFFSDVEGSPTNNLDASALDDVLLGDPLDGLVCEHASPLETTIHITNEESDTHTIEFSATNVASGLCDVLLGELLFDGDTLYDGPLTGLTSGVLLLGTGSSTSFTLRVRPEPGNLTAGSCSFDTTLTSYQTGLEGGGFSDTETISHSVFRDALACGDTPGTATSTVDLYLNKHISGETLGYELSDFSYRVTGNGVDVVVPHDSTTPLPVGTYTIEEIVPDGFTKVDWRIGWYGQCERGSTFTTTITIDERYIDYGILYCEADNQYRPVRTGRSAASEEVVAEEVIEPSPAEEVQGAESEEESVETEPDEEVKGAEVEVEPEENVEEAEAEPAENEEETNDEEEGEV